MNGRGIIQPPHPRHRLVKALGGGKDGGGRSGGASTGGSQSGGRDFRQGVVSAVNSDGTSTLTIGGSSTALTNVRSLGNAGVYAGATVWALVGKGDALIVGVQEVATGWVTSTTGFTVASNFSITSVRYRRIANLAWLYVVVARTTSALTVAAGDGDITNVDLFTAIPASITPAQQQNGSSGSGRTSTSILTIGGKVTLVSVAGDGTNIAISDSVSANFQCYPID